jgi:hypothetical protein
MKKYVFEIPNNGNVIIAGVIAQNLLSALKKVAKFCESKRLKGNPDLVSVERVEDAEETQGNFID